MGHLTASKPNDILAIDFTVLEPASDGRGKQPHYDRCVF